MYSTEFDEAFEKVSKEYPSLSKVKAQRFIKKLGELISRNRKCSKTQEFRFLLLESLKRSGIWDEEDRIHYKKLAGTFFGRRGGRATRCKKNDLSETSNPSVPIRFDKNGQMTWIF